MKHTHTHHTGIEDLLFAFQKRIVDSIRGEIKNLNCSLPQMELLRQLDERGSMSLSEVASQLKITKPSASVMIDGLEKRKLVDRAISKEDRRGIHITLTPASKTLIRKISEKKKKSISILLEKLTPKEKNELSALLTTLINE